MASGHTEHYQLNQWSLDDPVQMEEFNEDNRKVEQALTWLMNNRVRLVTGSYTGTGEYGPEHPTTLTFDFTPKLLFMYGNSPHVTSRSSQFTLADPSITTYLEPHAGNDNSTLHLIWTENSVSWYNERDSGYQYNATGVEYHYVVIGD